MEVRDYLNWGMYTRAVETRPKPQIRMTRRKSLFVDYYVGPAKLNATEAARMCGYKNPRVLGARIAEQLSELIDKRLLTFREQAQMSASEVMERLTAVARDSSHKDHVRAIELLAKIHGLLSEKVDLKLDRKMLHEELAQTLDLLNPLHATSKQDSGKIARA